MGRYTAYVAVATALLVAAGMAASNGETMKWDIQDIAEIAGRRAQSGGPWIEFLRVPAMRAGLYELEAGANDEQGPHEADEIYYIIEGRAAISIDGAESPVRAGSVIYVRAGVEHRFVDIQEALRVLVVFTSES